MVAWIAGVGGLKCGTNFKSADWRIFRRLNTVAGIFISTLANFVEMSFFLGKVFVVFQDWVLKSQTSLDVRKLMSKSTRILGCGNIHFLLRDHFRV